MRSFSRLALFALLTATPCAAQSVDTLQLRVDGRDVFMVVAGSGQPTIVLEAGGASTNRTWRDLLPPLARTHRVVAYDRAGLGQSAPSADPRSARAIAQELRAALAAAELAPPFVLVGHSAGGLYARVFAALYPDETAGVVLVDPAPEAFYARARREQPEVFAYFDSLQRVETARMPDGMRRELDDWEAVLTDARWSEGRYAGPVVLLSSARDELRALGAIWTDEQRRWAAAASNRHFVLVPGAGHSIHRERPDAVIDAVRRVLAAP